MHKGSGGPKRGAKGANTPCAGLGGAEMRCPLPQPAHQGQGTTMSGVKYNNKIIIIILRSGMNFRRFTAFQVTPLAPLSWVRRCMLPGTYWSCWALRHSKLHSPPCSSNWRKHGASFLRTSDELGGGCPLPGIPWSGWALLCSRLHPRPCPSYKTLEELGGACCLGCREAAGGSWLLKASCLHRGSWLLKVPKLLIEIYHQHPEHPQKKGWISQEAQCERESVSSLSGELKRLTEHCKEGLNDALRAQLVCGLNGECIQKKL